MSPDSHDLAATHAAEEPSAVAVSAAGSAGARDKTLFGKPITVGHGTGKVLDRLDRRNAEEKCTEQNDPWFFAQKCQRNKDQAVHQVGSGLVERSLKTRSRTVFHRSPRRLLVPRHLGPAS